MLSHFILQQTKEVIHDIDAYLQIKKLRHRELTKLCKVTELVRAELGFELRLFQSRAPALNYYSLPSHLVTEMMTHRNRNTYKNLDISKIDIQSILEGVEERENSGEVGNH